MSRQRTFPASRLVENNPRLCIDSLWVAGALHSGKVSSWWCQWLTIQIEAADDWITIDGDQRVTTERVEFLNGRRSRVRFLCGGCGRGCRVLHHTRDRGWACRTCSGLDYQSRHRNRWARGLGRLRYLRQRIEDKRRMRGWTKQRLRETMLAHEANIAEDFHDFVSALKDHEHGRRNGRRRSRDGGGSSDVAAERGRSSATVPRRR